jgi:hypothetical protein
MEQSLHWWIGSVQLIRRVQMEPEYTLFGGILRFSDVVREKLSSAVNVPDDQMVQYATALGAVILGHHRLKRDRSALATIRSQQLTFEHRNLRVDHSESVQLAAVSERKVLHRVRNGLRIRGVLQRSHQHEQRGGGFFAATTDYLCQSFDLFR